MQVNLSGVVGMVLGLGVEGHEFESCMGSIFFLIVPAYVIEKRC